MKPQYAIGLGFSSDCNMNCPFCYSKAKREQKQDIDLDIWYRFFDRNADYINSINYGTGENTTSDTWYQMIRFVRENYPHIRQALTTNGYLSYVMAHDSDKCDIVLRSIDEIDISLDFGNADTHNFYRGNPNAFDWANGTLAYCQDNNIDSTIVTLGIDQTLQIENMEKIFDIANNFGSKNRINLYRPVDKKVNLVPASLENILKFFEWVDKYHTILSVSDPLFSSLLCGGEISPDPSGKSSLRITQDGNIYPSTYLLYNEFLMGNINDFLIEKHLIDDPVVNKLFRNEIPKVCEGCMYEKGCKGGVLDRRYIWYGTFENRDPYCFIERKDLMQNYRQHRKEFSSVHDGYLPTLFFKP